MNKLNALEPAEPVRRYERENPGELIHLDIKKLGRIGSVGHSITGVAYFAKLGIRVERVMTDNDSCYRSKTFRTAHASTLVRSSGSTTKSAA